MAKLSKEQADQLAELERLRDAPDDDGDDDDGDGDDDGGVIVLRGTRADSFLEALMGSGRKKKKPAPAGDDDDGAQGDDDDGAQGDDDPAPKKPGHRYFR